jgi:Ca-activated chloride channel homolog
MRVPGPRWLTVVAVLSASTAVLAAQQAFRARVDLVRLPVVVTARDGQVVHGLKAEDFDVREEGRPQTVAYFVEGPGGESVPLHLGLLLDASESMQSDIHSASGAAVKFIKALDEAADVTYVDFDTSVRLGRFAPDSYPLLFERIRDQHAEGGTSLYDALGVYLETSLSRDGQHVLVLYTDGGDSTSSMTFGKVRDLLRLGNVIVYAIGYLENQISAYRMPQQMRVMQIARETGGEAYFPTTDADLDSVYAKILSELQGRYTLGYVSNRPPDGRFRKVDVRVHRRGLTGVHVRTRTGYLPLDLGGRH